MYYYFHDYLEGLSLHIENYNIHDIIKFQIVNDGIHDLLKKSNPEYEYFKCKNEIEPDFKVTVSRNIGQTDYNDCIKHVFRKKYAKWEVEIKGYASGFINIILNPQLSGIRNIIKYSALKNVYIRSLLYYMLLDRKATLMHASGINIDGKSYLFVGRPGVFKTSILMDIMKSYNASFLGEENVLIKNGQVYSFPLNIRSLHYKLKNYKNEQHPSLLHKLFLGVSLFQRNITEMAISYPCPINKVFYLEKGNAFKCEKNNLKDLIEKFIDNEMQEITTPPTHALSGITDNYFVDYLTDIGKMSFLENNLHNLFLNEMSDADIYSVTMPAKYDTKLVDMMMEV